MNHLKRRNLVWVWLWLGFLTMTCGATGAPAPLAQGIEIGGIVFVVVLVIVLVLAAIAIRAIRARQPGPGVSLESETPEAQPTEAPAQVPIETPPTPAIVPAPVEEAIVQAPLAETPVLLQVEEQVPQPPEVEVGPAPVEMPLPPIAEVPPPPIELVGRPFDLPMPPMPSVPQFLEVATIGGRPRRFSIDRARLTIGRAPDNDIVIGDEFPGAATVADHHAHVEIQEAWVVVEPASPEAVIFLNGQQTGRNILRNGWRLSLGECDLIFRTAGIGTAPLADVETEEAQLGMPGPRPSATDSFGPLADGAVLMDNYIVLESRVESPTRNTYVAESLTPVLACGQCGFDANEARQKTCRNCGALLADSVPYYPHYRIKESVNEQDLSVERQLVGLSHPDVLLPRQAFTETPFGVLPRYYVVEPEVPQLAASLRVPQEMPQVLEWTQHLAQGMAYLHGNGVSLGPIDLWRVALEGTQARWVDFSACVFVPESEQSTRFADEVCALAEIAYYLITSKRRYDESIILSPPGVGLLFDRVLAGVTVPTAAQFAKALQAALIEVRRPSSLDVRVGRLTDVGQRRQLNEDSLLTVEIGRVRRSISEPLGLYVVCDGMGGQAAGDVASGLVIQTLARKALAEVMSDGVTEGMGTPNWDGWLKSALQEANQAVFGRRRSAGNDMGTTCVAALVHGDTAILAHAGDSRCYLVNDKGIQQLTQDHSLVQRLIQLGQLTPEEARVHPRRNVIYKNLGDKPAVEPDVSTHKIAPGDRLVLCSDGLNTMVDDEHIQQIVLSACSPQEACHKLVQAANQAGGEDNISVIVVQLEALD